jgi:hypothetical protein
VVRRDSGGFLGSAIGIDVFKASGMWSGGMDCNGFEPTLVALLEMLAWSWLFEVTAEAAAKSVEEVCDDSLCRSTAAS